MKKKQSVAAALRYEPETMHAPEVSAVGERHVADLMRRIARRYGVALVDSPELAEDLSEIKVSHSIPVRLYEPVAAILAQCRSRRSPGK